MQYLEQAVALAPIFMDAAVVSGGTDEAKVLAVERAIINAHTAIKAALEREQKDRG
jgi:hypothetical protein